MRLENKAILKKANEAVSAGNNERFLSFCADESVWAFVGDTTLMGKRAIREYMKTAYLEPPKFMVENLIGEGEFVKAVGTISLKGENDKWMDYTYCDIWRFHDGKMIELKALLFKPGIRRGRGAYAARIGYAI